MRKFKTKNREEKKLKKQFTECSEILLIELKVKLIMKERIEKDPKKLF